MNITPLQNVAAQLQLFKEIEQKQRFLFVLGALVARLISLQKAAELLEIEPEWLLKLLDLMNIDFSYLSEVDIVQEQQW